MADGDIDYAPYSDRELSEALIAIDAENFPLNYRNLQAEKRARALGSKPARDVADGPEHPRVRDAKIQTVAPELVEFGQRLAQLGSRTPVTYALIAINVAVFVAMAASGIDAFSPDGSMHVKWGSNLVPVTVDGEWWRLATSMFLHFGVIHVAVNMWVLFANGRLTERLYGPARFLILYLFAGLAGSMASAWWHPATNSAGASGAVFGVLGGLLAFMLAERGRIPMQVIREQSRSIAAFVFYNIIYGVTHSGIDNAAHLGGLVGGAVMGFLLARPMDPETRERSQTLRVAGISVAAVLLLVAAADFIQHAKENLPPAERFAAAALWFDYGEPRALAAYNAMVELAQADKLTDAEFATRLAAEVIPFYEEAGRRLRFDPAQGVERDEFRRRLAEYLDLRYRSMVMFERALAANDDAAAKEAMAIAQAADEAAASFSAIVDEK